jgi:aminopeptidase N
MASLTWEEARDRASLIELDRYDVELDLLGLAEGTLLRSRSEIRFGCRRPGEGTFVDLAAEHVLAATLNGQALDLTGFGGERMALPALDEHNVLVVESTTTRTEAHAGLHRVVDPGDGEVYVWTTFEPADAHRVFACFDQPDLKAVFGIRARVPEGWRAVSNSPVLDVGPAAERPDGTGAASRLWTFADTPLLSTYLAVLCAGPFVELRREVAGHDLGLLCRASLRSYLERDADELFELTGRGLAHFGEQFAMSFPQRRYDQVFCPDFQGAMENFGCVVWTDAMLFRSPPTTAQRQTRAFVLLHEMAHMWFGDIVTMRWWDDLWLNESFADWAAVWAADRVSGFPAPWAAFAVRKEAGYSADRAPTTHPISQPVGDVAAATAAFDMVTYAKGASVLKQLAAYVGIQAFVDGLVRYFGEFAWGNATLADLLAAVATEETGPLEEWARLWLLTPGTSTLRAVPSVGPDGRYAEVAVEQSPPERFPVVRPHRLAVGVYDVTDGVPARRGRHELTLHGQRAVIPELAGQPEADLLLVNDDDLTFARVRLDPRSQATLLRYGPDLPDPVSRAVGRTIAWQLLDDNLCSAADFVGFALGALAVEADPAAREALLVRALEAATVWAPAEHRAALGRDLATCCVELAGRETDPSARRAALRALARTGAPGAGLEVLAEAAEGDPDLSWRLLIRRAALGDHDEEAVQRLLTEDPDPDAAWRARAVAAAVGEPAAKGEAWRLAVEECAVPSPALPELAAAFWQPHQEDLLRPYPGRYLEALPGISAMGFLAAYALTGLFFPVYAVDGDYPDRVEQTAAGGGLAAVVAREVRERADVLRRVLAARELAFGSRG